MEIERFKNIEGYEGLYQVSNLGNVKSLNYGKERILKPIKNGKGYLQVILCKNGKHKMYQVHRLVATVFLPNPNNLPCVNHKDENSLNNCLYNLEWCTYSYNNSYGTKNQRTISTRRINDPNNESYQKMISTRRINNPNNECYKKAIKTRRINNPNNECYQKMVETKTKNYSYGAEKPVVQYTKDGIEITTYKSINEASRQTNISDTCICNCCKGKYKSCGKFVWKYL